MEDVDTDARQNLHDSEELAQGVHLRVTSTRCSQGGHGGTAVARERQCASGGPRGQGCGQHDRGLGLPVGCAAAQPLSCSPPTSGVQGELLTDATPPMLGGVGACM